MLKRILYSLRRFLSDPRGSSPVVAAVVLLPLLVATAWGFAWLGHMADAKNVVEEAARAGARWLASHPGDIEGAKARAAEVVQGAMQAGRSYIPSGAIPGVSLDKILIGKLTKSGNSYVIHDRTRGPVKVKPSSPDVKAQMDALVGKVVAAGGEWAEAGVFLAQVATTDPPETQTVRQTGGSYGNQPGTQGSQTVGQTRHPGPFPAAVLAQYGQGKWGTWWTSTGGTVSTNGALRLQVSYHYADVWSNPWSPPGGGKIKRIHIRGKSERNYDYGYVYGWNGSSWVELARRCSPGYDQEYDEWIDVSSLNITQIKTRLTTDYSVLYSPTYVDVPEVEVEGAAWPDPGAWWIWGQPGAGGCAPNGQEVTLTSPVWWTADYGKYRLYATADDWFSVRVDSTDVLQGSGRGVKTWDWEPGRARPVQFTVTARNDYGPAGFLCAVKQTGWHWPVSYVPRPGPNGMAKYPEWTVPYAQWVTVTAKDRYGRAVPVYVGASGTGGSGGIQPANGALRLQVSYHNADVWSNAWSPPGGGKIRRIHIRGKSERYYDYGYVYGWNGSSWVELARRCSPGYDQEYDEWIDVSSLNITQIRTRLTTDYSVLYSPTYVDVPEVETEGQASWVASGSGTVRFYAYPNTRYFVCVGSAGSSPGGGNIQSTNGALRLQVNSHNAHVAAPIWSSGSIIARIHLRGNSETGYDFGYVYGTDGGSWFLLAKRSGTYDEWVDVSSLNITSIYTLLTTDSSVLWNPTYVDVPEVEVRSALSYDVIVDLDGGIALRSNSSWTYTPVDGVSYGVATLPQRAVPGAEFTVRISATNLARKEWFASRPSWWPTDWNGPDSWRTNFSYHWYDDRGNLVVQDGLRTGLPQTVPPGGAVSLDLKVKVPSQPGRYRLVIDGVQEYCAWFGPLQGVNWPTLEAWIDVGSIDYGVSYDPAQAPKYMVAGETYTIRVTARNTGSLTWTPQGRFGLAYHWYDKNSGRVVVWDGARDYVDWAVAPGQTYTFSLPVTAPSKPGTYTLVIDMVHEGVTWFEQRGCPVLRADVEVPAGDVLKGPLAFDGEDYWVGNVIVRSAGPDLSRFAGANVILWGRNTGQRERFFRVKWIQEYVPDDWTALVTFDPEKDVLCNDPVRGDPQAPAGDPVSRPRTDGYAYCRVTYHYPVPLKDFWSKLASAGTPAWRSAEPPSRKVVGEAFFLSGEAGQ